MAGGMRKGRRRPVRGKLLYRHYQPERQQRGYKHLLCFHGDYNSCESTRDLVNCALVLRQRLRYFVECDDEFGYLQRAIGNPYAELPVGRYFSKQQWNIRLSSSDCHSGYNQHCASVAERWGGSHSAIRSDGCAGPGGADVYLELYDAEWALFELRARFPDIGIGNVYADPCGSVRKQRMRHYIGDTEH